MGNILISLDTAIMYDDEKNKVFRSEIEGLVNRLERDVNVLGFNPEKIYDEFHVHIDEINKRNRPLAYRYAENRLFILALHWINFWGTAEKNKVYGKFYAGIDGRNEIACEICKEICQRDDFKKILNFYTEPLNFDSQGDYLEEAYKCFIEKSNIMHKTNMQTATGLMIYALTRNEEADDIKKYLSEKYGDKYYKIPLI